MTDNLLTELCYLFTIEANAISDAYAWPPRQPMTEDETAEVDRLMADGDAIAARITSDRICYDDAIEAAMKQWRST